MKLIPTLLSLIRYLAVCIISSPPSTGSQLLARGESSCTNNGCVCWGGSPQGQYCGWCGYKGVGPKEGKGVKKENVYECKGESCCEYGYRDSCAHGINGDGPCGGYTNE